MVFSARRRALLALCAGTLAAASRRSRAHPLGTARASAVKAAFLYKFGSFVEWPPGTFRSASAPLVIGVYGDDGIAAELEQITQDRAVEGHPVTVRRVRDTEDLRGLHVLFAGGPRASRIRDMLAAVRGPVLTVADRRTATPAQAVLFFTEEDARVRFGASLTAAAARGLKLSAKLLAVAENVEGR